MKKLLLIALLLPMGVVSCVDKKLEKPFVVIDKSVYTSEVYWYTYQDANGRRMIFTDHPKRFNVGDTIK